MDLERLQSEEYFEHFQNVALCLHEWKLTPGQTMDRLAAYAHYIGVPAWCCEATACNWVARALICRFGMLMNEMKGHDLAELCEQLDSLGIDEETQCEELFDTLGLPPELFEEDTPAADSVKPRGGGNPFYTRTYRGEQPKSKYLGRTNDQPHWQDDHTNYDPPDSVWQKTLDANRSWGSFRQDGSTQLAPHPRREQTPLPPEREVPTPGTLNDRGSDKNKARG
jgi:hypothetical protein